jgi:mannose-6-phosphate isomerase-like protein (cupin superfamily)
MIINPTATYVLLNSNGSSEQTPGGEAFWSKSPADMDAFGNGWLVSEFHFDSDWMNWEMHPHADEVVYLLSGELELLLEQAAGLQSHHIKGPGMAVIPKGVWHTAKTVVPCRMLHITMGVGTQHRSVAK